MNADVLNETQQRELRKLHLEMGPVVLGALSDPRTVECVLNPDGRLWQERLGEPLREIGRMDPWQAEGLIGTVASILKTTVTRDNPLLEGELPDGNRFAGQLPPVVSAPCFAIRKKASAVFPLPQYVECGIMTQSQSDALCDAIWNHRNLLVSGSIGAGKSTLINALLAQLTDCFPQERLLILEDTTELQCSAKDFVQYRTTSHVGMTQLLKTTLRMRPDRILVGEVRGPEALDLLMSWNVGHPGGMCTLHANDAKAALSRLRMLISQNRDHPDPIEPLIGEVQPVVVHITRGGPAGRQVREVLDVHGYDPDRGYRFQPVG